MITYLFFFPRSFYEKQYNPKTRRQKKQSVYRELISHFLHKKYPLLFYSANSHIYDESERSVDFNSPSALQAAEETLVSSAGSGASTLTLRGFLVTIG